MNYLDTLLFGVYPYLALAVFIIGSWIRYDHGQYTWKAGSSQMLRKSGMSLASNLFHIGILLIFFGHLVGLLTPSWLYEPFMSAGTKQLIAIVVGGFAGTLCWIGSLLLLKRRLTDPRVRASGTTGDTLVIAILFVQVTLGMLTLIPSMSHLDGAMMQQLSKWAQSVVTLQGNPAVYMEGVDAIYRAHIFLGMTIFVIFPFTRLVHIWSAPVEYLSRRYQLVRRRG
ncbi:respiratory nitrate reductase subunit gamma [Marinospirillum alkaliphilum]|uniref:nitrate reductase (quinone) n=1 Tax=Marinospirillum alkaliphilum DSM 21637 TaxID=1122209 RepID=A0A1K1ZLU8_9GAMM|nr:respiratory nitrate reductase subunit gamma [Marinospirillum alkaliphilum]SFX75129.1 nitrate reductase gamma subunit [Marinospirillum alkaliphilum DSM 21637]